MYSVLLVQEHVHRDEVLLPVPAHQPGRLTGQVLATLAPRVQHVLGHLGQLACLGGGPAQALQQAGLPSGQWGDD